MRTRRLRGREPTEDFSRRDPALPEWLGGAAGGCRAGVLQRLVARLVDREDAVEPRDLEDLGDVLVGADERQRPAGGAQSLDPADQHAERGGVDEGRLREVDDELLLAVLDHL